MSREESWPAVRRWLVLFNRAETLMHAPDAGDPTPQRTASRALDALFLHEHGMSRAARRRAREEVWRRDHPDRPLLDASAHDQDDPRCRCAGCRREWERCRCRRCRAARFLGRADAAGEAASPLPPAELQPPRLSTRGSAPPVQLPLFGS